MSSNFGSPRQKSGAAMHINNPCAKEYEMSMKCLNDNGYSGTECKDYFQNYKNCKRFWSLVQSKRKEEGIEPALPPPEEREAVKQKYLPHLKAS